MNSCVHFTSARGHTMCNARLRPCTRISRNAVGIGASRVDDLISLCERTAQGTNASDDAARAIMDIVQEFKAVGEGSVTTGGNISATWRMLWTTEKETKFIVDNAGFFGTKAGDVYQVIDVEEQRLQNVITFPPDGAFVVDSGIDVVGEQRINFKFKSATLKLPKRNIGLPPFGQGWFETIYMDDRIRIAEDIRGDTLIVARDGPPRSFL